MRTLAAVLIPFFLFAGIASGQTVATDKSAYLVLEPIVVNFSGLPGNANDWVTIVQANAADRDYGWWTYLGSRVSGSVTVTNTYDPGTYEARIHVNNSDAVAARARFTISYPNTTLSTDKSAYLVLQPVVVTYANMPGYGSDWVTIVPANSTDGTYWEYYKTDSKKNGTFTFTRHLEPGTYQARAFYNNTYDVRARTQFTVSYPNSTVTTNKTNYAVGESIVVTYANLPGYAKDYITIVPANSPDFEYWEWYFTDGKQNGTMTFTRRLDPGTYQARVKYNNEDAIVRVRTTFTVGTSCPVTIAPALANPLAAGGSGTINVTAASGCAWAAASDASWITVSSGASGTGNGTVTYSVAANSGSARTGNIIIANQTFAISQAAGAGTTTATPVYLRFENGGANSAASGAGSILDSSGFNNHGTPSGSLTYRSDVPAANLPVTGAVNARSLDLATNGIVRFDSAFPLNTLTNATMEFWIKPAGASTEMDVLWTRTDSNDRNRFNMGVITGSGTRTMFLDYRDPNGAHHLLGQNIPISNSTWTHVAFVKSGNVWTSYVDGVQRSQVTDSSPSLPNNTGWTLNGRGLNAFAGSIDEFRISDSALAPSQFLNAGTGGGGTPATGNLVQNWDAEAGPADANYAGLATIPGWTTDGKATVFRYGSTDFLTTASPGPANRGNNFFGGGVSQTSKITQIVSVSSSAAAIDAGTQPYTLAAWLGGWDYQDDNALLRATFKNAAGATLGTAVVGPVLASHRNNLSALLERTTSGLLPVQTRQVELSLEFERTNGTSNDGYADNIYFGLTASGGGGGGGSCTYTLSAAASSVAAAQGQATVSVTTQTNCGWTATSNASWISIISGASWSGNGNVVVLVAANTGAARTGTVTIGGQTFTVNQAAGTVTPPVATPVYLRFENGGANAAASGAGTILDSSGFANHGSPSGALTYRTDVPAANLPVTGAANTRALEFGQGGSVQFASAFPLNTLPNATLEFWVKPTGTHPDMWLLWTRTDANDLNRFNLGFRNDRFFFDYRTPAGDLHTLSDFLTFSNTRWCHIAIVKAGNVWTTYVDGVQKGQVTDSSPNLPNNTGWTLSGRAYNQFTGLVDEFRISNSALTPAQFLNAGTGGGTPTTGNLVQNWDAEAGPASAAYQGLATIPGWTTDGNVTVYRYDRGDELTPTSPGPTSRGNNFFGGGAAASAKMTQVINLTSSAAAIDTGNQPYTLAGWLGGWEYQSDNAMLRATFKNASGAALGSATIGPVLASHRNSVTALLERSTSGRLPAGTRQVELSLEFTRTEGSLNDGFADNLYFGLTGSGGGTTCAYAISPNTYAAGTPQATVTVTITTTAGCAWTATSNASWITVTSGASGSGSGTATLQVAANTGAARTGTATIAGQTFTVTQSAGGGTPGCNYFVQPLTQSVSAGTYSGITQVITNTGCAWTATSNASWITILGGAAGTGSGAVSYRVAENPTSSQRTGTVTIAGQTFTVTQAAGAPPCSYTLTPVSNTVPALGGSSSFALTTGVSCTWTAAANVPWIQLTGATSGTGSGTIRYTVAMNTDPTPRTGTITAGGQTFTITQAGGASATGPNISQGGITNAASNRPGVLARGSFFTIYGARIGPAVQQQATVYPIPDTMGGVVVNITQGSNTRRAYLHFVSETQINGILPSTTPLGDVQISVTFNGVTSQPETVKVVNTAFGIFTTQGGQGPGIIQNWNSQTDVPLNMQSYPAKPNQIVVLWGTGMGPISTPDNEPPPGGNLNVPVEVRVGNKIAATMYNGRAPYFAAVDNIYFTVPPDAPVGCSVPVQVKVGGSWSNAVRMAISSDGSKCRDTHPLGKVTATGGKTGTIALFRADLTAQLDPATAPQSLVLDLGMALFSETRAAGELAFSPLMNAPPIGTCGSLNQGLDLGGVLGSGGSGLDPTTSRSLDAGPALSVGGPAGTATMQPLDATKPGPYFGLLGGALPIEGAPSMPLMLDSGPYAITATGGADVGPFAITLQHQNPVSWTNAGAINRLNRANELTVNWSGGDSNQTVVILGFGTDQQTKNTGGFMCLAPAAAGTFTVPPNVLADLPASAVTTGDSVSVALLGMFSLPTVPQTFTAAGLDGGIAFQTTLRAKTVKVE